MPKLLITVATAALLGLGNVAFAGGPMQLTNGQMDKVTAGAASSAIINLEALASGGAAAAAETQVTSATIIQTPSVPPTTLGTVIVTGFSVAVN